MTVSIQDHTLESTHLSGNPFWVRVNTTLTKGVFYKVLLKIESPDGVLTGSPFIDEIVPDVNGDAWFNISGYVNQFIQKTIHFPVTTRIHAYSELAYDIWLYPGESYIDLGTSLPVETFEAVVQPFFVVKGKLPEQILNQFNQDNTDWFNYYSQGGRFLSNMPKTISVSPFQPLKIWYKHPTLSDPMVLTCVGTFSDGTTQTIIQNTTLTRASLYEFDLHPETMGFTLDDGTKRLVSYTFTATGCETRTYIVDWTYHEKYWYLFVDNGIGGVECLWLKGDVLFKPSAQRTTSKKPSKRGTGAQIATRIPMQTGRTKKWVINSGIFPKDQMKAFDIILDASDAWLAIPPEDGNTDLSNYTITPVIITNEEATLSIASQNITTLDIEMMEAH